MHQVFAANSLVQYQARDDKVPQPEPLSTAALPALAIVAYEQPVTRADISRIRGADSDGVVASLLAHGLIAEERQFVVPGGSLPLLTTPAFLRQFGLGSVAELPPAGSFATIESNSMT